MFLRKPLTFALALALGCTAFSEGVRPIDPLRTLRQDPSVRSVTIIAVRASGPMIRLRLQAPREDLYVLLSNEATTPTEAAQVRQISLWLNVPAGRSLSTSGMNSLIGLASKLGHLCLNQRVSGLSDVLQVYVGKTLSTPGMLGRFAGGIMLEVVPSPPWAPAGLSVKVTLPQWAGAAVPRCVLPASSNR